MLLSLFLALTAVGWGLAYTPTAGAIARLVASLVLVHFLASSLVCATAGYFLCARFLKLPAASGLARAGFSVGEGEMEWMYCWEIAVRAFFPVWVFLYVVQFLLMPIVARDYW